MANFVQGTEGNDGSYSGGVITDPLTGTDGADNIYARGGDDVIEAGGGNDNIYAGDGNDRIYAGDGDDFIDGGAGADIMYGGAGNDTYVVDNVNDKVREDAAGGIDTVKSYISYTLGANVEILRLIGTDDIDGKGNDLNNTIIGNSGNNSIQAGGGNDSVDAGAGDDVVDGGAGNDFLKGGDGIDLVTYKTAISAVTVDLAKLSAQDTGGHGKDTLSGFENLEGSSFDDKLFGDSGANMLKGLAGNDILAGRDGNDVLVGGTGADTFVFTHTGSEGTDTINDFSQAEGDKLALSGYTAADVSIVHANGYSEVVYHDGGSDSIIAIVKSVVLVDSDLTFA
jgi:Ca2+-binding RTX toxin-like protein